MTDRCTGHCCRVFGLPHSPEDLTDPKTNIEDQEVVADMAIPIYWVPDMDRFFSDWTYTCRHLQPNGDCAIYEQRPKMCRDYPYDEPCHHPGCTLKNRGEES